MTRSRIQNFKELAITPEREHALSIVEAGLAGIDTETAIKKAVQFSDGVLEISDERIPLADVGRIFIFGFGKAAATAAEALESILGERIEGGVVICVSGSKCKRVETFVGTHPHPTEANVVASKRLIEVAKGITEKDLALVIVSGGGSALTCWPENECDQGSALYNAFLKSNGTIHELNIVRKHLSMLKGGGLAKLLYPARIFGLVFSDVPGVHPEIIASGPTYLDNTTIKDAEHVISKYKLGSYELLETPKEAKYFERITNVVLVSNLNAITAMEQKARELGYEALVLSTKVYDEVDLIDEEFAHVTRPGRAVVAGGEPRLVVGKQHGSGGRNQHLALSMALKLKPKQVFVSLASDGRDNSDVAGGIVDLGTLKRAENLKLDLSRHLADFDAMTALVKTGDAIRTGPTGANVSDLMVMLESTHTGDVPIESVHAKEIQDSRGTPTLLVDVVAGGKTGEFAVPSGASTGAHEALELRDGDMAYAGGKGVSKAIENVEKKIAPMLKGQSVFDQRKIDSLLLSADGTANKSSLGANAMIGASVAAARAAAKAGGKELFSYLRSLAPHIVPSRRTPYLYMNLINGGKHAKSRLAFQEYHVVPMVDSVAQALEMGVQIQQKLERVLHERFGAEGVQVGDEGGFAVDAESVRLPLEILRDAVRALGIEGKVRFALDVAASSFFDGTNYFFDGKEASPDELFDFYLTLIKDFDIVSIEDPFHEEDFGRFAKLKAAAKDLIVIGDDLTVTNVSLLKKALEAKSINGIIIKPNQIGTLTETIETVALAREHGVHCVVSHRSGETADDFIADLAVAFGCFGIKAGAPRPAERLMKYRRLCAIEKLA